MFGFYFFCPRGKKHWYVVWYGVVPLMLKVWAIIGRSEIINIKNILVFLLGFFFRIKDWGVGVGVWFGALCDVTKGTKYLTDARCWFCCSVSRTSLLHWSQSLCLSSIVNWAKFVHDEFRSTRNSDICHLYCDTRLLLIGQPDSSVSRKRSLGAAADGDGLMAQWQRTAGMPTVVWTRGLYLCGPLYPLSCLPQSLSSSHPPSLPPNPLSSLLFFHCLRKGSSCASVVLRSLCFAQTTACLKILALGAPSPAPRHTDPRGRLVNSVGPYITPSCGGSGASLEASEEWGTCRSASAETFSTRRQKVSEPSGTESDGPAKRCNWGVGGTELT